MSRLLAFGIAALVLLACGPPSGARLPAHARHLDATPTLDSMDSLRLAALPEIVRLSEENMGGMNSTVAYCLSTSLPASVGTLGAPPSAALLAAVAGRRPAIYSVADCAPLPGRLMIPGVAGRAWRIWIIASGVGPDSAVVTGGYDAGVLEAAEWSCSARKDSGKWTVLVPCRMTWVS